MESVVGPAGSQGPVFSVFIVTSASSQGPVFSVFIVTSASFVEPFGFYGEFLAEAEVQKSKMISGVYRDESQLNHSNVRLKMEHCALDGIRSKWIKEVRCREKTPDQNKPWINLSNVFPDAQVAEGYNNVQVIYNTPMESYEFAVFGTPEQSDKKRMQMGIFGENPVQGRDWKLNVILFDDTVKAFEHVCELEKGKGNRLLTTLAGLFVSNSDTDIKIELSDLAFGWTILGSKIKTIKSKDAWNSPENSADFPRCNFIIRNVEKTKQFFCGITASHEGDAAETEVVEVYQEDSVSNITDNNAMVFSEFAKGNLAECCNNGLPIFLLILGYLAICVIGSDFRVNPSDTNVRTGN